MVLPYLAGYGALCAAGFVFAAHSKARAEALTLALCLAGSWLLWLSAWTDYAPAWMLYWTGIHGFTSYEIQCIYDAILVLVSVVVFIRVPHWWSAGFVAFAYAGLSVEAVMTISDRPAFASMSWLLDYTLIGQWLCIILSGVDGVGDRLSRYRLSRRMAHRFRPAARVPAQMQEAQ